MKQNAYRWFPHWLIAGMIFAFLVNAYMVYAAVEGFPGVAGQDGSDLSKRYDKVMAVVAKQAALGWQVDATLDETRHPVLHVTDKEGVPLSGAAVQAEAERPLGPAERSAVTFHAVDPSHYEADAALAPGQWDVLMTVTSGESRYTTTRRLLVK
ncbi:MAG: FixH family protein [Rhodopila sp.]